MAAPGDVSRAGAVARRRTRRANRTPTPTRTQVRSARAQQAAYVSQGASTAHSAYLANPVPVRRAEVRRARAAPKAQRTGGQHLLLGTHGARVSARGRAHEQAARVERSARAQQAQHAGETVKPRADIVDLRHPFKGFHDFEKRAVAGKLSKAEVARAGVVGDASAAPPIWFRGAKAGTLFAMEQLLRPSSAIGAAALERSKRGKSTIGGRLHAAGQGFLHPTQHSQDWVQAAKNVHAPLPVVTGTAASMVLDPTTYIGGGVATPAKAAALRVYSEGLAAGMARHEAVAAAREAWERAPAHLKVPGVHLNVSGIPTRAVGRRSLSTGASSLGVGRAVTAGRKAGFAHAPVAVSKGRIRNTLRSVSPGIRPHGVDPLDWEFIRRAGTQGRAGERAAVRGAEATLHGYHRALTKDHTPERGLELMKRLESLPHIHTEDQLKAATAGLSKGEANAVRQAAVDRAVQYATEPGRVPLTAESRVGFAHPPVRPTYEGGDVAASKRVLEKAERRMAAAHRVHGEEKGRRAMTNMRVPGQGGADPIKFDKSRAYWKPGQRGRAILTSDHRLLSVPEEEATHSQLRARAGLPEFQRPPMGKEVFDIHIRPDGTFRVSDMPPGMTEEEAAARVMAADRRLKWHKPVSTEARERAGVKRLSAVPSLGQERAAQELEDAAEHLKLARRAHRDEVGKAARDRKAYREHIRQVRAYQAAPAGYVHRSVRPEELAGGPRAGARGGGTKVGGASYMGRSHRTGLGAVPAEQLDRLETRLPVVMAERALEHGRNRNVANVNDWIEALGHPVEHAAATAAIGSKARLYVRDDRGLSPLFDKFGKVDKEAVDHAVAHGQRIVEVPEGYDDMVRHLARGQRAPRTGDPFDLVGRDTAEQGGTVGLFTSGTRKLKWAQTQINPSYWIRNFFGDYLNANIAGAGVSDLAASKRLLKAHGADRKALRMLQATPEGKAAEAALHRAANRETHYPGLGRKASDLEVVRLAAHNGAIDTGILQGELHAARHGVDTSLMTRRGRAGEALGRANDYRENLVRLATFRSALKRGLDPEAAAQWSLKHHFDYGDLSPAEQTFWRNIFPFWTFMARNTPLQVAALARRPGVLASVEKARRGSLQAAGLNPNLSEGSENFEQSNTAWGTPFKWQGQRLTAAPGLSTMDLTNIPTSLTHESLKNAGGNVIGRAHPLFTAGVLGALANKNSMNLDDLPPYLKAPSWWDQTLGQIPGVPRTVVTRDPRSGEPVRSLPGRLGPATSIIPLAQVAMKVGTKGQPGEPSAAALRTASWALGPRIAIEGPHKRAITQSFHRIDQIDHELQKLEPRALKHKPGDQWGGRIRELLDEKKALMQNIYKHSKAMGAKNPLGTPPAKKRHKGGKAKIPGGLGTGSFGGGQAFGAGGGFGG